MWKRMNSNFMRCTVWNIAWNTFQNRIISSILSLMLPFLANLILKHLHKLYDVHSVVEFSKLERAPLENLLNYQAAHHFSVAFAKSSQSLLEHIKNLQAVPNRHSREYAQRTCFWLAEVQIYQAVLYSEQQLLTYLSWNFWTNVSFSNCS